MTKPILACQIVSKIYQDGTNQVEVLSQLDLTIQAGDTLAIVGSSGSGKSTLLHILGGLDSCTTGSVSLSDQDWCKMSEQARCKVRNQQLGFVYQFHHLLPEFSALENVMMPLFINGQNKQQAKQMAQDVLSAVGLASRVSHKPGQLSGGERQRVAIARAIVMKPACILADEPTGNLDNETARDIFDLFLTLNQQYQTALVVVTHDLQLANQLSKQLKLSNGKLGEL